MAAGDRGVVFRVLGPLELLVDGRALPLGSPQLRRLLAALLVQAGEVVPTDRLFEVVWRGEPPARAASALQKLVYRLRTLLAVEGRGEAERPHVSTRPPGYALETDPGSFDAARFEALVSEARATMRLGDSQGALRTSDEALGLWRGPAFVEFAFDEFARAEAARLDELRLVAIEERIDVKLARGDHDELVAELESLVSVHRFRERLWAQLMLASYRAGRQTEALRAFGRLRQLLGEELGIEPSASLRSLEEAMVLQAPELDWTPITRAEPSASTPEALRSTAPSGTVTFLFTDVEGSTRLWEGYPDAMRSALARHDEIIRAAIENHDGYVVKTTGDGFHAVFATARDAVGAAAVAQVELQNEPWDATAALKVRMGVHTCEAEVRDGDYYGGAVNRAARLMSVAHGGQVVVSTATEQLLHDAMPEQCGFVDLGEHRLRDLGRPERLFQLVHPDLGSDFGALRTLDASQGNLPLQASSFVGRDAELLRVVDTLEGSRVVTLTGVGGVGKTRLALQVAGEVLPRFPGGAWLCELASVRDPAGVVDAVAGVFRVSARPGLSLEECLVAYLRDQELLVMLDNCEHLLRAVARLVVAIEAACGGVRVLATSREGLNIAGEQILVVPSLGLPDDDATIEASGECEAVQLFVDRARGVTADFTVDGTNRADVLAVCTRLDGVALAIELAAARIPAMSPAELARRLDRRFRLLSGGGRVAIERHQTLRAAIDWSYELLSEPEQQLLARLAVFSGGCTLEATEAVCTGGPIDGDEVFELLAGLVARSLVVADTGPETRYRLLETIRQYGEERLAEAGEADRLRVRHAEYYTELAEVVGRHLYGSGQLEWGARLAREHDNLLAAMAYALDSHNVDLAFGLFCQVPAFGLQINELVVFDSAPLLALAGATEHPASAVALMSAGFDAWRRGDPQRALVLCDQGLAAEHRLGPTPGARLGFWSSVLRGLVAQDAGAAEAAGNHNLDAARRARSEELPALAALYLGIAAQTLSYSDPAAARHHGTEGLALARQTGMPLAIVDNLLGLALAVAASDPDQARALLSEALQVATTLGYENPNELQVAVFVAAHLEEWPTTLRVAGRVLHHHTRSGALPLIYLAGILNLVARGLAESQPKPAATLQGTIGTLIRRLAPDVAAPISGGASGHNDVAAFLAEVRRDTTQLLTTALSDTSLRDLRAQGAAMDETQACVYARTHIDEYLASTAEDLQ